MAATKKTTTTSPKKKTTKPSSAKKPAQTKETDKSSTMPNKFVLGSRKLFDTKAPWRLNDSFLGRLSSDHYIAMFTAPKGTDMYGYGTEIYKKLSKALRSHNFEHKVFVGYKHDCLLLPTLKLQFNITFDAAFFIDNPYPQQAYESILKETKIYNIYSNEKNALDYLPAAKVNQFIPTLLPANMSNRIALEATALLMYDVYDANDFAQENKSMLLEI
jgi:hypothetical protein